jgi:hypothetical protein
MAITSNPLLRASFREISNRRRTHGQSHAFVAATDVRPQGTNDAPHESGQAFIARAREVRQEIVVGLSDPDMQLTATWWHASSY